MRVTAPILVRAARIDGIIKRPIFSGCVSLRGSLTIILRPQYKKTCIRIQNNLYPDWVPDDSHNRH
jgi:hypothetical protein